MKSMFCLIAVVVQLVGVPVSIAYQLNPISRVFAPSGSKATQSFELVNNGPDRIALTVTFTTLARDERYVETSHGAEDEFLAYPAQMILAPGARQTVRVTWLGTPKPVRELTYRIVVTQVPLHQLDPGTSTEPQGHMRIMLSYRGTLFIRPPGAAPKLVVHGAEPVTNAAGHAVLALVLENIGTAVGLVKACTVHLLQGGLDITLAPAALTAVRNTRVLGGDKRRYEIAWPPALPPGPVRAIGQCAAEL